MKKHRKENDLRNLLGRNIALYQKQVSEGSHRRQAEGIRVITRKLRAHTSYQKHTGDIHLTSLSCWSRVSFFWIAWLVRIDSGMKGTGAVGQRLLAWGWFWPWPLTLGLGLIPWNCHIWQNPLEMYPFSHEMEQGSLEPREVFTSPNGCLPSKE